MLKEHVGIGIFMTPRNGEKNINPNYQNNKCMGQEAIQT